MNSPRRFPASFTLIERPVVSRRLFLKNLGAGAATISIVPASVLGASGGKAPNSRITLAGVGIGGVGFSQLQECQKAGFQIVALCDVDSKYGKKAFDRWPEARKYRDFRELLSAEEAAVDSVYCGTPDHTHALVVVGALRRKKHVCCVKPLTRTISELRVVVEEARKAGTATQVTAAANTSETACRTCEILSSGALGEVRELHLWSNRPVWPQGMMRPRGADPVPEDLDWKLWLGPAPIRPFKSHWEKDSYPIQQMNLKAWDPGIQGIYHPFNFRGWWDFGTGALGDMGCHHFNTPFRALKLGAVRTVEASATKVFDESAPLASTVTFEFPERAGWPPLSATWYDGGLRPVPPGVWRGNEWPDEGTLYVGDKGYLLDGAKGIEVGPDSVERAANAAPKTLQRRSGTWAEWYEACQGGQPAGCEFAWAGPLTEAVLLGNLALRAGKPLQWNSSEMRTTNHTDVSRFVQEPYQNGWSLSEV